MLLMLPSRRCIRITSLPGVDGDPADGDLAVQQGTHEGRSRSRSSAVPLVRPGAGPVQHIVSCPAVSLGTTACPVHPGGLALHDALSDPQRSAAGRYDWARNAAPHRWPVWGLPMPGRRSEEHTSELQSRPHLVCRLLLEKKKKSTLYSFYIVKNKKNRLCW